MPRTSPTTRKNPSCSSRRSGRETTLADALAERVGAERLDVGALARSEGFHGVYDAAMDTHELAEEAPVGSNGGDVGVERGRGWGAWIITRANCSGAVVRPRVRVDGVEQTATLYERLSDRGYSEKKIRENVECDIFQVGGGGEGFVRECDGEVDATLDDMERRCGTWWCEN